MTALLAWIWTPLLLLGLSLGWAILADAALRTRLPPALLAPAGLALIIVVASLGFRLRLPTLVFVALVAGALAGLVAGRVRLRRGPWDLPGLVAAGSVYALYMAPIVFSGEPTWAGYNFVNDTASNFVLADVLEHQGVAAPGGGSGTAANATNLLNRGYPLGAFSLLAGLRPLTGAPLEAVYQPVMAMVAGLGAMSLTEIGRRAGLRAPGAALAATLAMGGVLLYRYVLHGAIKEVVLVVLLITAVALAGVAVDRRLAVRSVVRGRHGAGRDSGVQRCGGRVRAGARGGDRGGGGAGPGPTLVVGSGPAAGGRSGRPGARAAAGAGLHAGVRRGHRPGLLRVGGRRRARSASSSARCR